MRDQLRSELVKLRSTRTNLGLLLAMVGLVLLVVVVTGCAVKRGELTKEEHQRALFAVGFAGSFIASLIGVMAITSEFRHGTIRPTFVFTPARSRVLVAKLLSSIVLGVVFALVAEAVAIGVGLAILSIRGVDLVLGGGTILLVVLGSVVLTALMAAFGVGFGAIVHNQVLAVIALVVWFMVIEGIVRSVAPSVGKFFPLTAGGALRGIDEPQMLTAPQGAFVLVGYVTLLFVAGLALTRRGDVN